MKNRAIIIICYFLAAVLTVLLFMAFALPFLLWTEAPLTSPNVWIVDKTVPNNEKPEDNLQHSARTNGTGFQILSNNQWVDFFSKGVNIGSSSPAGDP